MADTWHAAFFRQHIDRFVRHDWPPPKAEFWSSWKTKLGALDAKQAEAEAASLAMFVEGPIPATVTEHPSGLEWQIHKARRIAREKGLKSTKPVLITQDNREHNDAVIAHWGTLPKQDRDDWIALAKLHKPWLASWPGYLLAFAQGWAFEPHTAPAGAPPPPETPRSAVGRKRQPVKPKG